MKNGSYLGPERTQECYRFHGLLPEVVKEVFRGEGYTMNLSACQGRTRSLKPGLLYCDYNIGYTEHLIFHIRYVLYTLILIVRVAGVTEWDPTCKGRAPPCTTTITQRYQSNYSRYALSTRRRGSFKILLLKKDFPLLARALKLFTDKPLTSNAGCLGGAFLQNNTPHDISVSSEPIRMHFRPKCSPWPRATFALLRMFSRGQG